MTNELSIKGKVISDERQLERYGSDLSHYYIRPGMVAIPSDEHDIVTAIGYAAATGTPVTPRGAGSNLSGSAVGDGLMHPDPGDEPAGGQGGERLRLPAGDGLQ